jgi:hypothetical protein
VRETVLRGFCAARKGGETVVQSEPATPEEVLKAFFTAMRDWEAEAFRQAGEAERAGRPLETTPLRQQREALLARYCTRRRRVFSSIVCYGATPEYDPDKEDILQVEEVSDRRVVIHTRQRTGFKHQRRFTLLKHQGRWLVDGKLYLAGRKWHRDHL